ncbi:MAG TPA: alpha/beta hydrolase [Marmoricola sp.]|nr:alpha/beta hydrolase [Marmoricola sp.]
MTSTPAAVQPGYDDLGAGTPTVLLLPGWCGDRGVFGPMSEALAAHRRVLVDDLRGHGGNAHQTGDFDSAAQVDDVVALLDATDVDRVVPVTLSHAGWHGIELRRRLGPERVPGLVLLDWMPIGPPPGFLDALAGLQDPTGWHDVRAALFGMWTDGVTTPAVHDYVASMAAYGFEHWSRAGREISTAFARDGAPLDALGRLDVPCPTLHLYAQPADDGYLAAQQHAAAELPWFSVERLDALSHFPMLEVPDVVAARIESFVAGL